MKKFLLNVPPNLAYKSVIWNVLSNSLNAVVSVVLLWAVTRINGTNDAGVFSLGFSTAQMMLTIGNFGMRNYQSSDVSDKYSQEVYLASRWVTSFIMMAGVCGFVLAKGYYPEKALVVVLLCILKVTDALDDVYGAYYQRMNRLDLSGKILFLRIVTYSITFVLVLLLTHNMCVAILAAIAVASALLFYMVRTVKQVFPITKPKFLWGSVGKLLAECLPLCISAFLLVYMVNAPKYAIDSYMSNEMQAYYNYLFMPCFVINLFVGFVLQPLLVRISVLWKEHNFHEFKRIMLKIYGCTLLISLLIVLAGRFAGCYFLSIFFGVDLNMYSDILTILLCGGAFFALASITQTILTVMRHQYSILWGVGISNALLTVLAPILVREYGLHGAAWSYTGAAGLLFLVMLICIVAFLQRETGVSEK